MLAAAALAPGIDNTPPAMSLAWRKVLGGPGLASPHRLVVEIQPFILLIVLLATATHQSAPWPGWGGAGHAKTCPPQHPEINSDTQEGRTSLCA